MGPEPSVGNLRRMDKSTQVDGVVSMKIPQSLTQHYIALGTSNDFRENDIDTDIMIFCTGHCPLQRWVEESYSRQLSVLYEEV